MEELYKQYYALIFKYILYLTHDREVTNDLLQETFLRYFQAKKPVQQERALLIKIARNLVYDHWRRKRLLSFIPYRKDDRIDEQPLPFELLEQQEDVIALYDALQKIKLSYREAVVLRYIEELPVKEVAELLGCSEAQVKNNTARGLKALKKVMEEARQHEPTIEKISEHTDG